MRQDEAGNECPATLGEYLAVCEALGGKDCFAVMFLAEKIARAPGGSDELVTATDLQMRALLLPLLELSPYSPSNEGEPQ